MFLPKIVNRQSSIVNRSHGFSLIELLVVIAIIGILVSFGSVSWTNAQQKSRDTKRKSDLKSIQQALETFYQQNGRYPLSDGNGLIKCSLLPFSPGISWGTAFACGSNTFMQQLPTDPVYTTDLTRQYYYSSSGTTSYRLYASLENASDPDITSSCSLINWNYCVIQP